MKYLIFRDIYVPAKGEFYESCEKNISFPLLIAQCAEAHKLACTVLYGILFGPLHCNLALPLLQLKLKKSPPQNETGKLPLHFADKTDYVRSSYVCTAQRCTKEGKKAFFQGKTSDKGEPLHQIPCSNRITRKWCLLFHWKCINSSFWDSSLAVKSLLPSSWLLDI